MTNVSAKLFSLSLIVLGSILIHTTLGQIDFPEFEPLGTIGNKTFYTTVNRTFEVNWPAAKYICNGVGLEFGILHSDAEFDFVRSTLPGNTAKLWIDASMRGVEINGGRSAFVYGDGTDVNTKGVILQHHVCLYFSADDHIFSDMCYNGSRGVLCHSYNGTNTN